MIKRILVGLGGEPFSSVAVKYATELAQRLDAEVMAVTTVNKDHVTSIGPVPLGGGEAAKALRDYRMSLTHEKVEAAIASFEACCQEAGVSHDVQREERDTPLELLVSRARYYDLLILGLHSIEDFGISGGTPTDILFKLLDGGGIHPIVGVPAQYRPINKVMIAYSGSIESAKTMKRYIELRLWPDAEMKIVTFQHPEEKANELLGDAAAYCKAHGFDVDTQHYAEKPYDNLLPAAESYGADLIVMGNSAKNMLLRQVFGETALQAIRTSELPLFLSQ